MEAPYLVVQGQILGVELGPGPTLAKRRTVQVSTGLGVAVLDSVHDNAVSTRWNVPLRAAAATEMRGVWFPHESTRRSSR